MQQFFQKPNTLVTGFGLKRHLNQPWKRILEKSVQKPNLIGSTKAAEDQTYGHQDSLKSSTQDAQDFGNWFMCTIPLTMWNTLREFQMDSCTSQTTLGTKADLTKKELLTTSVS